VTWNSLFNNQILCRKDGITFHTPCNIISGCELLCGHTCGNYHTLKSQDNYSWKKAVLDGSTWQTLVLPNESNKEKSNLLATKSSEHFYHKSVLLKEMREQGYMERNLQLLHNITGAFQSGVLSALMGVTGAGKTTLLDVLAGRKTGGVIEGDIRIGGYPKVQQTFARISGYCEQTDVHSPQITVGESVAYSAWLRLPTEIDSKTRDVSYN